MSDEAPLLHNPDDEMVPILVTCAKGIAPFLAAEIRTLGYEVIDEEVGGVWTKGGERAVMRLNLFLRTGMRVLRKLDGFKAHDADALYRRMRRFPWEEHLDPDTPLCITSSVTNQTIRDTRYPNLKAKDAICDRLRDETGSRPDTGPERDDAVVFLHWRGLKAATFIDTSGDALTRRGYRRAARGAPMQEALAAALVLASGWDPTTPFVNPMCGSGTLAIEAALIAMNRAPGMLRDRFGFMSVYGYEESTWRDVRREAAKGERPLQTKILASDVNAQAVLTARETAIRARVDIEVERSDFRDVELPPLPNDKSGLILLNPPYGERLGDKEELIPFYQDIGTFFKHHAPGWTGAVFTGNPKLGKQVNLRPRVQHSFYNGAIECRLSLYDLWKIDAEDPEKETIFEST